MRLKFLIFAILLFEFTVTSPFLVRNHEQIDSPTAVFAGLFVLVSGAVIALSWRRPIALRSCLNAALLIGLLNVLYGGIGHFRAREQMQFERWAKANAVRAYSELLMSPYGRWRDSSEWAIRINEHSEEIAIQERRIERSQWIMVAGGLLALSSIGIISAARSSGHNHMRIEEPTSIDAKGERT